MIRYAARADFDPLYTMLAQEMVPEQALFALAPVKAAAMVGRAIDDSRVLISERDGVITGSIGFDVTTVYYSEERFVADLWIYVRPLYRKSTDALRLRNALKADARRRGLPLMAGALGKRLDGSRLFKGRNFMKCAELFFMPCQE